MWPANTEKPGRTLFSWRPVWRFNSTCQFFKAPFISVDQLATTSGLGCRSEHALFRAGDERECTRHQRRGLDGSVPLSRSGSLHVRFVWHVAAAVKMTLCYAFCSGHRDHACRRFLPAQLHRSTGIEAAMPWAEAQCWTHGPELHAGSRDKPPSTRA